MTFTGLKRVNDMASVLSKRFVQSGKRLLYLYRYLYQITIIYTFTLFLFSTDTFSEKEFEIKRARQYGNTRENKYTK